MTDRPWPTRPVYPQQLPAIDTTVDLPLPVTEQQWLGNTPLSAALEDAEGRALVEAIHDPANPRLEANRGRD